MNQIIANAMRSFAVAPAYRSLLGFELQPAPLSNEARTVREEKLAASLSGRPRALSSLVEEVYDDVPEPLRGLARRSLLAGLEKLREEGRATRSAAGWSSTRAPLRADPDARRAGA